MSWKELRLFLEECASRAQVQSLWVCGVLVSCACVCVCVLMSGGDGAAPSSTSQSAVSLAISRSKSASVIEGGWVGVAGCATMNFFSIAAIVELS